MTLIKKNTKFFKHDHVFTGYCGGTPYLTTRKGVVDGIGRMHVDLYGVCDICNEKILVAKIHATEEGKL